MKKADKTKKSLRYPGCRNYLWMWSWKPLPQAMLLVKPVCLFPTWSVKIGVEGTGALGFGLRIFAWATAASIREGPEESFASFAAWRAFAASAIVVKGKKFTKTWRKNKLCLQDPSSARPWSDLAGLCGSSCWPLRASLNLKLKKSKKQLVKKTGPPVGTGTLLRESHPPRFYPASSW